VALYTKESKDRVRDAVDFLELVSARTDLRRAGPARYEGLCPFHEERTPSFGIDPTQKVYYCFGCQASGDVFTFVQETEGVDFKGALELLSERYGVELQREEEDPREAEKRKARERLLELLSRTASYYERYLWEAEEAAKARVYLQERGLGEEILREFRVGYAPSAWDRVLLASRRGGFTVAELYATGLAQRSKQNGQPYDRFRSRIMFPLADTRGRVLGFGARAMSEEQKPKYLNTSDNDVYHKGLNLYGADLARAPAAKAGQVILCEGYTDTIALHQAGMRTAVGLMGTALTGEQVGELARMAQTVLLALDADAAGQDAMLKASSIASKRKLELRVVPMPAGTDPAEIIQRDGPEAMRAVVDGSVPFVRFSVERVLAAGDDSTSEGQERIVEQLRPIFALLEPRSVMRVDLMKLVARGFGEHEQLLERRLASARAEGTAARANGTHEATAGGGARGRIVGDGGTARRGALLRKEETERAFLALCIASRAEGEVALAALDLQEHFSSELLRRAARHLREGSLAAPMADHSAEGEGLDGDPALKALLAELVVEAGRDASHPAMLEVQRLQLELARLERRIQQARGRQDVDVSALATRRGALKREFDTAYAQVLEETGER
jgi:DNA primase